MRLIRQKSALLVIALVLTWMPMLVQAEEITVESFSFDCHNKTGYVGETTGGTGILQYSFEPYGASESVTMISSDPAVASVEYVEEYNSWRIYYHKLGTAVITATTASGLTDTCNVTVTEMETVYLDQPFTVTVQPHDTVLFEFTAEAQGYYSFYSENGEGKLNINWRGKPYYGNGVDTQELYGAFVLAVWNNSDAVQTYTLCVREAVPVEEIIFEQEHYYGYPGDSECIGVSLYPVWSIPEEPVFSSSDENVVYYDPVGSMWVTLADPGTATITATTQNGVSAQCAVTVLDYESIQAGDSKTITLDYQGEKRYEFKPETDGEYVFYTAIDGVGLSVSCDGVFVGEDIYTTEYMGISCEMEAGKTYILRAYHQNAEDAEITQTVFLDEMKSPEAITIASAQDMIFVGEYMSLFCKPEGGIPFITGDITWSVSDESVISLDYTWSGGAGFKANTAGSATVTATLENGVSASYEVIVSEYIYYDIISGHGDTVVIGTDDALSIHIDAPFEKFNWYVSVDGIEVPSQNYTAAEGSTIITLDSGYLATLEPGGHVLVAQFKDGEAGAGFVVQEKPEYAPGDINGDGKVNNRDAARLMQHLAGWDVVYVEAALDVNGDGKVNNRDAVRLLQYLAGWDVVIH